MSLDQIKPELKKKKGASQMKGHQLIPGLRSSTKVKKSQKLATTCEL